MIRMNRWEGVFVKGIEAARQMEIKWMRGLVAFTAATSTIAFLTAPVS